MPQDTKYAPVEFIFKSVGIVARPVTDETPPHSYLNLQNAQEREEFGMTARYGSIIINRDPDGTPNGQNYFFANPIVTLSRLRYNALTWRYAGDNIGNLYRRAGDTQGPYGGIYSGLSGKPFSSAVNTCFGSSQPFLFIADAARMIKDNGTGTPAKWGIAPPNTPVNSGVYAPQIFLIEGFNGTAASISVTNVTGWAGGTNGNVIVGGAPSPVLNFSEYTNVTSGITNAFNGCLASLSSGGGGGPTQIPISGIASTDSEGPGGPWDQADVTTDLPHGLNPGDLAVITGNSFPRFNGNHYVDSVDGPNDFTFDFYSPRFVSGSGGYLNNNSGGGGATSGPQALFFNIYTTPQPTQFSAIGVGAPLNPATTTFAINYIAGTIASSTSATILRNQAMDLSQQNQSTSDDLIVLCIQFGSPGNVTGVTLTFDINNSNESFAYYSVNVPLPTDFLGGFSSAWVTHYLRMGDFTASGQAGTPGFTWANVTGWRIDIKTGSGGSTTFALNALYQQWGYGPSSFGGVGYDYRYTYYDNTTKTESNPSSEQYFSQQYGYVASLSPPISLRQAIDVQGVYSSDPQVTHVRLYRRGGTMNQNWFFIDQIPNVTGTAGFTYFDTIPDSEILQANVLVLDNDVPVTSTLQNPISTFLTTTPNSPGITPYSNFTPQTVSVSNAAAVFTVGQIVDVGSPLNFEQVYVTTGGTGQFTAVFRLIHNAGDPVYVFSTPGQPCDLCEVAYGQIWIAGDPNNPHFLYFTKPGYPENVSPKNYIPVSEPSDPIMGIINFRGTLFAATLTTWYQIIGGSSPYAQPTGSKHGLVAKHGYTQTESAVWYQAIDGIREFRGADGAYRSLPIEWLYRQIPQSFTPIPLVDTTNLANVVMAFQNNYVYVLYPTSTPGTNSRVIFSTVYNRWRNDNVNATTMYFEEDTNTLLYSKFVTITGGASGYAVVQDAVGNSDDNGWNGGAHITNAIPFTVQIPFQDLGKQHFTKQWNMLELDINTFSSTFAVYAVFDEGNPVLLSSAVSTTVRTKVEIPINAGAGTEAYRMSLMFTGQGIAGSTPPILYQCNIYAAVLAANRNTFDTYWIKFNSDESKLIKEGYFDYTAAQSVSVSLYADGSTTAYYTFSLPSNAQRQNVPQRVRFPAIKCRLWRCIATSGGKFQVWSAPTVRVKACLVGTGYASADLVT